jgi:bifunctional non-homologous end joining protein LigD
MECLPVEKIPEGYNWTYELKLDGYRLQAVKGGGQVILYSRRGIDLRKRFKYVAKAHVLQNFRSAESHIIFYAFDILVREG